MSARPRAIFIALGPNKRSMDNESTVRQEFAKNGSIWDIIYNLMGQGLCALLVPAPRPSPLIHREEFVPSSNRFGQIWKAKPSSTECASRNGPRAYHLIQVIVNLHSYGLNVQAILRRCVIDSGIIHSMKGINALVAFRCICMLS